MIRTRTGSLLSSGPVTDDLEVTTPVAGQNFGNTIMPPVVNCTANLGATITLGAAANNQGRTVAIRNLSGANALATGVGADIPTNNTGFYYSTGAAWIRLGAAPTGL